MEEDKELLKFMESLELVHRQFEATNEDFIRLSLLRLEIQRFVNHNRGVYTLRPVCSFECSSQEANSMMDEIVCSLEEAKLMMDEMNYLISKLYYNILFE